MQLHCFQMEFVARLMHWTVNVMCSNKPYPPVSTQGLLGVLQGQCFMLQDYFLLQTDYLLQLTLCYILVEVTKMEEITLWFRFSDCGVVE